MAELPRERHRKKLAIARAPSVFVGLAAAQEIEFLCAFGGSAAHRMADQNRAGTLERECRIEPAEIIAVAVRVQETDIAADEALFAAQRIGAQKACMGELTKSVRKEGRHTGVIGKTRIAEFAAAGGMMLQERRQEAREFFRFHLSDHSSAPAPAICRRAQILPLMC